MPSLLFVAVIVVTMMQYAAAAVLFGRQKRKTYTPLLFFKVPKGTMDECDTMEKCIRSIEKEQHVHVERLDIMRNRNARRLYDKLVEGDIRSPFPLLYHRESLQRVYGVADIDYVRSWSKGRLLPNRDDIDGGGEKKVSVLGGGGEDGDIPEEIDMKEFEMEMDAELTPVQRRGKEAMKRRMEEGRKR
jgi:hypothetical protein